MAQGDAGYRAFFLNDGGHITSSVEITAPDDETAFAQTQMSLHGGQRAELWQEARYIGVVQACSTYRPANQATSAGTASEPAGAPNQP